MLGELGDPERPPIMIYDRDFRGHDWQKVKTCWILDQYEFHAASGASHHLLLTDDLALAPGFWEILTAMVKVAPNHPIGLLSNSPQAPALALENFRWYATNSWIVGPARVLPASFLERFLPWRKSLPPGNAEGCADWYNDDSAENEFNTRRAGGRALHPLPTIIEHRHNIASMTGHGDRFSRERVSWRNVRTTVDTGGGNFEWRSVPQWSPLRAMAFPEFWLRRGGPDLAPMLPVGGP